MKHLTTKEIAFLNALQEDNQINKDKSFLELLFIGELKNQKDIRTSLESLFAGYYSNLFNDSDLLIESVDCLYIGKYNEYFWGTGSEGEVFGLGQDICNMAFVLISSYYGDKDVTIEYFKNHLGLDYHSYIQSYRDFCKSLGYDYKEDFNLIEKQSERFENILDLLK